jgi:hypothetical protein
MGPWRRSHLPRGMVATTPHLVRDMLAKLLGSLGRLPRFERSRAFKCTVT